MHIYTHIYTMEYYSAIKKNEVMPFITTWMDLEIITLNEVSQRKTNIIRYCLHVESKKKKKGTNELIYKTETDPRLRKGWIYGNWGEDGKEGQIGSLGFLYIYTAIFKIDNQQAPTV